MSRVLIDTQALIWFAEASSSLTPAAVALVDDPTTVRLTSAASIWEMAIKMSLGKLALTSGTLPDFVDKLTPQGRVPERETDLGSGGLGGLLGSLLGGQGQPRR